MTASPCLHLVFGDQLFPHRFLPKDSDVPIWMAEDHGLCTTVRHHKQKLVLFLAAMRSWRDAARQRGRTVLYRQLDEPGAQQQDFWQALSVTVRQRKITHIQLWDIADRSTEAACREWAKASGVELEFLPSPGLLTPRDLSASWFADKKTVKQHDFYCWQRRRLRLLVDADGRPEGGQWSFDADNRQALPNDVPLPERLSHAPTKHVTAVMRLVEAYFPDHPGSLQDWNWPTTRRQALAELKDFCQHRLPLFGRYQDALSQRSEVLFHSLLSPLINLGLLTPAEVVEAVLAEQDAVPLSSLEGFVRQLVGWREFLYGVHHRFGAQQWDSNYFDHHGQLSTAWWTGETTLPLLDSMIDKCQRLGYAHHIERLMVAGNVMLLAGVHPHAAWRWFMELFIDSAEWVMGPNVFGMALFSDGGVFATKPYICASAYWRKQAKVGKAPWCDGLDGLYWQFVDRHQDMLAANHRTRQMTWGLQRLSSDRRRLIFKAGDALRARLLE